MCRKKERKKENRRAVMEKRTIVGRASFLHPEAPRALPRLGCSSRHIHTHMPDADDDIDDTEVTDGGAAWMQDAGLVEELKKAIVAGGDRVCIEDEAFLRRFLYIAKGDVTKAASRHARYWEYRIKLFGSERPFDKAHAAMSPWRAVDSSRTHCPVACR